MSLPMSGPSEAQVRAQAEGRPTSEPPPTSPVGRPPQEQRSQEAPLSPQQTPAAGHAASPGVSLQGPPQGARTRGRPPETPSDRPQAKAAAPRRTSLQELQALEELAASAGLQAAFQQTQFPSANFQDCEAYVSQIQGLPTGQGCRKCEWRGLPAVRGCIACSYPHALRYVLRHGMPPAWWRSRWR